MINKLILIYALPESDREEVSAALAGAGLPSFFVPESSFSLSLREVLEFRAGGETARKINEPFAVLHGLTGEELNAALKALRGGPVSLKAITTPHNLEWSGEKLFGDLKREREAIRKARGKRGK